MTFADLGTGEAIFLDANLFVYHFVSDPVYGAACSQLLQRVENHAAAPVVRSPPEGDRARVIRPATIEDLKYENKLKKIHLLFLARAGQCDLKWSRRGLSLRPVQSLIPDCRKTR